MYALLTFACTMTTMSRATHLEYLVLYAQTSVLLCPLIRALPRTITTHRVMCGTRICKNGRGCQSSTSGGGFAPFPQDSFSHEALCSN